MSKAKRKRLEKEAAKLESQNHDDSTWQGKRLILIVSAVFIALVIAIIGINYYFSDDQKYYRIDVIQVDDEIIDMDYFVRRCYATNTDPMTALSNITNELVIKKEADDIGLTVSSLEIDQAMMDTATSGDGTSITQSEFNEWFKQRLNVTKLTEKEYKSIVEIQLLSQKIYDLIVSSAPTAVPQVHLNVIVTDTEEEAIAAKERLEAGEDFAVVASEISLDSGTRESGGDIGWVPRGIAWDQRYDTLVFDELAIGEVSEPQVYYNSSASSASAQYQEYYLLMVSERTDSREIDEQYINDYMSNVYEAWLSQAISDHEIHYNGIKAGFDSETYTWINWQLQKMTGENDEDS